MSERQSKSEKRELRQSAKRKNDLEKSVKFAAVVGAESVKQVKIGPIEPLAGKVLKTVFVPEIVKEVRTPNQDQHSLECNLTWCISHADVEDYWSWKEPRAWSAEEWTRDVEAAFTPLERSTWHEIQHMHKVPARGDRLVAKNHFQEISSLVEEAQQRWLDRGLEQYDTAFRFRFGGTVRAWGIKLAGHFYLVWWERYHKIYPVGH